jgi:hypothetical protein
MLCFFSLQFSPIFYVYLTGYLVLVLQVLLIHVRCTVTVLLKKSHDFIVAI